MEPKKPDTCPRIKECEGPITRLYFDTWCQKPIWENCHYYCRWARTLKKPFEHLQTMAVEQSVAAGQMTREVHR